MFEIPHYRLAAAAEMTGQRPVKDRFGQPSALPRSGNGRQNVLYFHLARVQSLQLRATAKEQFEYQVSLFSSEYRLR